MVAPLVRETTGDALLRDAGWQVNDKRVERLWRREGLKVPMKQPKKGRLWLNDGSCVGLRPKHRNHVWSEPLDRHWSERQWRKTSSIAGPIMARRFAR